MNIAGPTRWWQHGLLAIVFAASLVVLLALGPIQQAPEYHNFADNRTLLGIPNFMDVVSNLPFLIVGAAGLWLCIRGRFEGTARVNWTMFFAGLALVGAGSAYYHWKPDNNSLIWDRLPLTMAFMAMFTALLGESLDERFGRVLLIPALLLGCLSVAWWLWSGDLRLYAWVQYFPLLAVPLLATLFARRYSHQWLLLLALGCYVLAKLFEVYDRDIFAFTRYAVGGHVLKHLFAATGCLVILEMLRRRKALGSNRPRKVAEANRR